MSRRKNKRGNSVTSNSSQNSSVSSDADIWIEQLNLEYKNRMIKFDNLLKNNIAAIEAAYDFYVKKIPRHLFNRTIDELDNELAELEAKKKPTEKKKHRQTKQRSSSLTSPRDFSERRPLTRSSSFNSRRKIPQQLTSKTNNFKTPGCIPKIPNFVTPKVPLNAPLSVARYPQQGEVAISLQGSPLMVAPLPQNYRANACISLPDGKVMSIFPEHGLQPSDIPDIDEETKLEILTLKQNLDAFINMSIK
ncbi:hypothetical protein L9F63_025015 [Diploptera punctata]|uniref:Borealin C-terminal domain-containing protein n=1 Tax=Diploptera punctata TaxID=6984 RepID=A0AAD7ZCQ7_DIPPU|nr:hypothetical protein L9F63_025015 [Diploptera punctata]